MAAATAKVGSAAGTPTVAKLPRLAHFSSADRSCESGLRGAGLAPSVVKAFRSASAGDPRVGLRGMQLVVAGC